MRLIDADALLKTNCNECTLYPNDCLGDDCDNGAVIHIKEAPTIEAVPSYSGLIGWVCPVCGRGLSPYTAVCPCQNQKGWEITCG